LVDALVADGQQVTVVDNLSRGHVENLTGAIETNQVKCCFSDIATKGVPTFDCDIMWHLAAKVAGIDYNRKHQYEMLHSNLIINYNAIEAAKRIKPGLFVYFSSACVYPHDAPVPTPEETTGVPEESNAGYAAAKLAGEEMVKHLALEYGIPSVIIRPFNACGPRDHYDPEHSHVIPALIRRVMEGENPISVWGSGRQTRVFVDARDIAKILLLIQKKLYGNHQGYTILNVGHDQEVSIAELVDTIIRQSGKDTGYVFDTSKPDGSLRRASDVRKLRNLIGSLDAIPLEDTLRDMIAEFKEGRSWL
jgi:GDP-L-fucose synthase